MDARLPVLPRREDAPPLDSLEGGPRATRSLRARGSSLAPPSAQRRILDALPLAVPDFAAALRQRGLDELRPAPLEIFQINVGRLCNMTCRHCHVDAGPDRTVENMDRETVDLCLAALDRTTAHTVDITGGAPELNPHFRYLVEQCVARGKHVIDRCNLTILLLPRFADLPEWLGARGVEVVGSQVSERDGGVCLGQPGDRRRIGDDQGRILPGALEHRCERGESGFIVTAKHLLRTEIHLSGGIGGIARSEIRIGASREGELIAGAGDHVD
jgi:hypothetical protein